MADPTGNSNADLSDLTLSAGTVTPTFGADTTSYTASVSNATTNITVTPTAAGSGATITVNGQPVASGTASQSISLNQGDNVITTVVTAQGGTTMKTYTVTVNRAPHMVPVVTNTNDSGAGSLREALLDAQDGDTITFSIARPELNQPAVVTVITLTSGELTINKNVTISGPGADLLIVERATNASAFRIFNVTAGGTVTIQGMTISNGSLSGNGGGIFNDHATLTVNRCAVSGNIAFYGGAVFNDGTNGMASLTITNSMLNGNSASFGGGGGIYNNGQNGSANLTILNSTFSGNSAAANDVGGAIVSDGSSGGTASLIIADCTLSGNSASMGGGIFNVESDMAIGNTILKTGSSGENIVNFGGSVTTIGYNLSNDSGGGFLTDVTDQVNTDPFLGPLKNNGGPTLTYAPLSNSPAIDRGHDIGTTGQDQRGSLRPVTYDASITPPPGGDRSDIGAVELSPGVLPVSAVSRKTHGGAGDFDINLPLTGVVGVECRSGGVTNDYKIVITFASPVTFSAAAVNDGTGSLMARSGSGTTNLTVDLTGVTNVQRLTLALFDVNDGVNSGDVGIRMGVLIGDTSGSGTVNSTDVSQTKLRSGQAASAANFRSDVNASGAINATDVSTVKIGSGSSLP